MPALPEGGFFEAGIKDKKERKPRCLPYKMIKI
jgi:hypothetical protein